MRTGCAVGHIEHNAAPWLFVTVRLNVPACIPVGKVATIGVFVSETNVSFVLLNGAVGAVLAGRKFAPLTVN